ncbi:hypothetical protein C1H46_032650 [Malus baccata]|uniref:Tryptophan--tRNA ligase, cytoplasmic n=1 Tax=Malus baccata TaxID=106549 RepID=A0A540L624_MALBA|nr:hypothetical protein C1H46_032650 [Malus baccata]
MSASDPNSAIYVTDSAKEIKNKINRYAFSGGQDSVEKHRELGANLEVDIPFKYLSFFLDYDDKLEEIRKEYGSGRMLTDEVKQLLVEVLTEMVERHRRARAAVTDEMVDAFMAFSPHKMCLRLVGQGNNLAPSLNLPSDKGPTFNRTSTPVATMEIDLVAGGKSKKTKCTVPKSDDIYLKLLVRLLIKYMQGKDNKFVVVVGTVTDDIRVYEVLQFKVTTLRFTEIAAA